MYQTPIFHRRLFKNNHNSLEAMYKSDDDIALIPTVVTEAKIDGSKNPVTIHYPILHNCEFDRMNDSEKPLCAQDLGVDDIPFIDE